MRARVRQTLAAPSATLAGALAATLASGCIVDAREPHDPYGTIAFDWTFDGIARCSDAGVDEVDVVVLEAGQVVLQLEREPCVGGGLELSDILEGTYEVVIDAYDRESFLLYSGGFMIDVIGGRKNYAGVINLAAVGTPIPPPPAVGEIELFWGFAFPTNDSRSFNCYAAGVDEVDVIVTPMGAQDPIYADTFNCTDDGVLIADLPDDTYDVEVIAFGEYHGEDLYLYDSGVLRERVMPGTVTALGDVVLARVDENFSDFNVAWSFAGGSCNMAGVMDVTVSITRIGDDEPEDVVVTDCDNLNVLREIFVPGSYNVAVGAIGAQTDWVGVVTVDLPPGSVADVDLVLAPAD